MMVKYKATVTHIGPLVSEFIAEGIIVLFGSEAPEELVEFSIIHDGKELTGNLVPEDMIEIDSNQYKVMAVGEVVNTNLANLGHLILKFNGENKPEMPGDVCVEKKSLPVIEVGTTITIFNTITVEGE